MNNNKLYWMFLGLFFGAILTIFIYYLYPKYLEYTFYEQNVSLESQVRTTVSKHYFDYIDSEKQSLKEQIDEENLSNEIALSDIKPLFIWRTESNYYISTPASENILEINFRHPKLVQTLVVNNFDSTEFDYELVNNLKLRFLKLVSDIDKIMSKNGYQKSEYNLVRNFGNDSIEVGYERNEYKCILGSYYGEVTFICNDKVKQYEGRQVDVMNALGLYGSSIVSIEKEIPKKFMKANITNFGEIGGYYSILQYKETPMSNTYWFEVYAGQDRPKCSLMEKYNVPKSIYEVCIR